MNLLTLYLETPRIRHESSITHLNLMILSLLNSDITHSESSDTVPASSDTVPVLKVDDQGEVSDAPDQLPHGSPELPTRLWIMLVYSKIIQRN